ncbi:MAG: hypothetical protein AAFW95_11545 [Cyanobacteria bacterium J06638_6]
MKITIEIDGEGAQSGVTTTASPTFAESVEFDGGGPGPEGDPASFAPSEEDAGSPPEWLVEAVASAMNTQGDKAETNDVGEDAGAGPTD